MQPTPRLDVLGNPLAYEPIPQPLYSVGSQVDLSKVVGYNRPVHIKRIRTNLIRRLRATVTRLQADGYLPEMQGKKFLEAHKAALRKKFDFMETAEGVYLAGLEPSAMQSYDNIANQCYMSGSAGYGKMCFNYFVLFRKYVDGNELVYMLPFSLLHESEVGQCIVNQAQPQPQVL
jgi:hypothetical protein